MNRLGTIHAQLALSEQDRLAMQTADVEQY